MQIHCLGTAGYHPNETRQTSCYFLPHQGLALDAGSGVFRIGERLLTDELDILLSHAHLDHVIGLTFLLDTHATTRLRKVRVWSEPRTIAAVREHVFASSIFPVMPDWIDWCPLTDRQFDVAGFRVTVIPLDHPGGSIGFRLDHADVSVAYITDTTANPAAAYVQKIRRVDLLLHECNFNDQQIEFAKMTGHSWTTAVAQVAVSAQVKRVLLTHMNPQADSAQSLGLEEFRRIYANAEMATDGMVVEI